jgi:hypothetical protein
MPVKEKTGLVHKLLFGNPKNPKQQEKERIKTRLNILGILPK